MFVVNCIKKFFTFYLPMFSKVMSSLRLSAPGTRISFDARNNRIEIIELSFFENSYDAISKETKFMESTNEIYKIDTAISAFSYKCCGSRVKLCVFNDNITFRYWALAGQQPRPRVESRGVEQPQDGGEVGAGGHHAGAPAPPHPLPLHRLRAVSIISQQVLCNFGKLLRHFGQKMLKW